MSEAKKAESRPSGLDTNRRYISFDERGSARWNWKKYEIEVDSTNMNIDDTFSFLKALDVDSLRLQDAQLVSGEVVDGDPYNSPLKR